MTPRELFARMAQPDFNPLVLVEAECLLDGAETTLRFANRPYADAQHRIWDARITGGVSWSGRIDPLALTGDIGRGDIELDTRDNGLDHLAGAVWHGRAVRVWAGDASWQPADCLLLASGHIERLAARRNGRLNIVWRDELSRLDSPITDALLGGSSQNKDRLIPACFGEVFNAPALLVDAATHRYQVHGGAIEGVIEVRESGAPVPFTADPAAGTFTLGGTPVGEITADVQGDKSIAWHATVPQIVTRLATGYGDAFWRLSAAEVAPLPLLPQRAGLWVDGETSVLDAVRRMAQSVNAVPVIDPQGRLALTVVSPAGASVATVTAADIKLDTLRLADSPVPAARVKLGYGRNHAARDSGLAAGLPEASRALLATEYAWAEAADPARIAAHRLRNTADPEESALVAEADAQAIAAARLALRGPALRLTADANIRLGWLQPGDWVTLKHHQYGLASGRDAMVTSADVDVLQQSVNLDFWVPWQP